MKLLDILKETDLSNLTPDQKRELFKQGSIMIPFDDPSRPGASASQVINLPRMDRIKRDVIKNKQEFDPFTFHPDEEIQIIAKEINNLYNKLYRAMNALEKTLELKRTGKI